MNYPFDNHLTRPAAALERAAPAEWKLFVAAFKKYAEARRDDMMRAPRDQLERSQGMAVQCASLIPLLEDAVKSADRIDSQGGKAK